MSDRPDFYRIAREVTDEVLGEGAYAATNEGNPDPRVRKEVAASKGEPPEWLDEHGRLLYEHRETMALAKTAKTENDTLRKALREITQYHGEDAAQEVRTMRLIAQTALDINAHRRQA